MRQINTLQVWEDCKCEMICFSQEWAKKIAAQNRKSEKLLADRPKFLYEEIDNANSAKPLHYLSAEVSHVENLLHKIVENKTKGAMIHSKTQWVRRR